MIREALRWRETGGRYAPTAPLTSPVSLLMERYSSFSSLRPPSALGMDPAKAAKRRVIKIVTQPTLRILEDAFCQRCVQDTCFRTKETAFCTLNNFYLLDTSLTSKLVGVKTKYLKLRQSSYRLGDASCKSSTAECVQNCEVNTTNAAASTTRSTTIFPR